MDEFTRKYLKVYAVLFVAGAGLLWGSLVFKEAVAVGEFNSTQHDAEANYVPAQLKLAMMYHSGKFVAVDIDKARTWYHRAALNGNSTAQYILCEEFNQCS